MSHLRPTVRQPILILAKDAPHGFSLPVSPGVVPQLVRAPTSWHGETILLTGRWSQVPDALPHP